MKRRRLTAVGAIALFLLLLTLTRAGTLAPPVYAENPAQNADESTRQLLEKSLSVVEIDREIDRIAALSTAIQSEIAKTEDRLAEQEKTTAAQREKAGRVLQAYYMGRQDMMWGVLLSSHSLTELMQNWDLMDLIMSSDQQTLDRYNDAYAMLKQGYDQLQKNRQDLAQMEDNLRAQRERVVALQQELDAAVDASSDADGLRRMMDEMQAYWQNVGLYEVRRQFDALAQAMNKLPEWIQQHPDMLKTKGLNMTLTLTDTDLNDFLRSQDEQMKQFTIKFEPNVMKLDGSNDSIQVGIEGHYTVENEPQNAIVFHIDQLVFNGLTLPDTTRADLERQFDLGFYPQQLVSFVKANSVSVEEGQLVVGLRIGK